MNMWAAVFGVALPLCLNSTAHAAAVHVPDKVHSQVKHAAARLQEQLNTLAEVPADARVVVTIAKGSVPECGEEGFAIRSSSAMEIQIRANSDAGAANGIYRLLMTIRTRQMTNPFGEKWDLTESPQWAQRRVAVTSYTFDLTKITPDTWTFADWKQHIDFIREFNINYLSIMNLHLYHPDLPETYGNKWRFDVYKQVIAYAHELGMKVSVMSCYNQVPAAVFWQRPEWRTTAIPGYFGQALCWSKAKDEIMKYQRYAIDYLDGLDGIELMVTEPLGWCMCEQCSSDPAAVYVDAVKEFGKALRKNNPNGNVVFWNWLLGYLPGLAGIYPPAPLKNASDIEPKVLRDMPDDTIFLDLSRNQMRKALRWQADLPGQIEVLKVAADQGFRTINFMFFMDREFGMVDRLSIFPRPFLDFTVDEFEYTKTLPVTGVSSYRLAPPGRFLSDFFFMRKSWNPDLTRDQLVDEAAAYLTSNSDGKKKIGAAIGKIELYWHKRDRSDLIAARDSFNNVASDGATLELARVRDGLVMLAMIDDYARAVKEIENARKARKETAELERARDAKLLAVYQTMKQYPLYQGFTSDGFWEPRAVVLLLRPHLDVWADYINNKGYYD